MKGKNKIYTAADFARYHDGTMPPGEMHALEKAALEDPFLEDALEGYVHAPSFESDIEELHARLGEKRKKRNVFFISSLPQNKWWRIAALFIIIAGSGYVFYRLNYDNKENSLAGNKIKAATENKDNAALLKTATDSAPKENEVAFEDPQSSKFLEREKSGSPAITPGTVKDEIVLPRKAEPVSAPGSENSSKDYHYSDSNYLKKPDKESDSKAVTGYVLKGKVTDEVGAPVPFVNITDNARNNQTVADAEGRFFLRSKDSSVTAIANAAGFETKTFSLKKDAQPTIAMKKSNDELSAVVVTALGNNKTRKKVKASATTPGSLNDKADSVQITTAGAQPLGGQEKFDQYLEENLAPLYDENNQRLTGEVLLSFTINKKGRPKNIRIVKSSCKACEGEAIRLLQNGPGWPGSKDIERTIAIKF